MERLRKITFFNESGQADDPTNKIILYHGSDLVLERPLFNYGRDDNDYGRGFIQHAFITKQFLGLRTWELAERRL